MCGRAVQNATAVDIAASILNYKQKSAVNESSNHRNMSPGHSFVVLQKKNQLNDDKYKQSEDETKSSKNKTIHSPENVICTEKIWGLITRGGTSSSPLEPGPSKHFSNLMFNARSETAAEKKSFRNLLNSKSCIIPLTGFYEWKVLTKDIIGAGSTNRKQPYFVHRSDSKPLFVAGLYTSVSTGWKANDTNNHENVPGNRISGSSPSSSYSFGNSILNTFTILTTKASSQIEWLHHRMPVLLWDECLVRKWLESPSPALLDEIATHSNTRYEANLSWHPVSKKVSNVQYNGIDCMSPIKLEKNPSISNFFGKQLNKKKNDHTVLSQHSMPNQSNTIHKKKDLKRSNLFQSHQFSQVKKPKLTSNSSVREKKLDSSPTKSNIHKAQKKDLSFYFKRK